MRCSTVLGMASFHLLHTLEQQWATISTSGLARRRFREWQTEFDVFARFGSLREVLNAVDNGDADTSVALMWALLDLAAEDDLARRAVIGVLMPWLTSELHRVCLPSAVAARAGGRGNETEQAMLVAVNQSIVEESGRRNRWPIASLTRRTHHLVIRSLRNDRLWRETNDLVDPEAGWNAVDVAAIEPVVEPAIELMRVTAAACDRGVVSPADRDLIIKTRCLGVAARELAEASGSTYDAVKRRRLRAEARIADHVMAAA